MTNLLFRETFDTPGELSRDTWFVSTDEDPYRDPPVFQGSVYVEDGCLTIDKTEPDPTETIVVLTLAPFPIGSFFAFEYKDCNLQLLRQAFLSRAGMTEDNFSTLSLSWEGWPGIGTGLQYTDGDGNVIYNATIPQFVTENTDSLWIGLQVREDGWLCAFKTAANLWFPHFLLPWFDTNVFYENYRPGFLFREQAITRIDTFEVYDDAPLQSQDNPLASVLVDTGDILSTATGLSTGRPGGRSVV
jgi:hypothetical protein